eukprot:2300527-Rhodomonas_salina.2
MSGTAYDSPVPGSRAPRTRCTKKGFDSAAYRGPLDQRLGHLVLVVVCDLVVPQLLAGVASYGCVSIRSVASYGAVSTRKCVAACGRDSTRKRVAAYGAGRQGSSSSTMR